MHLTKRLTLVAAVLALVVLAAVPQASMASDASLKNVVLGEVDDLVTADAKVARALDELDSAKSARNARSVVHQARVVARRVSKEVKAETPSSANGQVGQGTLIAALKTEDRALASLAAGLTARLSGDAAKAKQLIGRGRDKLDKASKQGARAGALIRALPSR
jgi:hypothetical protein